MFSELIAWVGSGLVLVLAYILISNTLWLLFGSRLLQSLPGVDIKGIGGTFKIAAMLVLSALGTLRWISIYIFSSIGGKKLKPVFKDEVGRMIKQGARIVENRRTNNNFQKINGEKKQ